MSVKWSGQEIALSPQLAMDQFMRIWGGSTVMEDIATSLTCDEAEALGDLFVAFGNRPAAESLMEAHAEGDDCGDRHCTCGCEYVEEVCSCGATFGPGGLAGHLSYMETITPEKGKHREIKG